MENRGGFLYSLIIVTEYSRTSRVYYEYYHLFWGLPLLINLLLNLEIQRKEVDYV